MEVQQENTVVYLNLGISAMNPIKQRSGYKVQYEVLNLNSSGISMFLSKRKRLHIFKMILLTILFRQ